MPKIRSTLVTAAAIAVAAVGGGAIANAATSTMTTPASAPSAQSTPANFPAHGSAPHEDAEKALTGASATKAQAAAVKAAGGGKAGAVTSNFTGDGYEVTVTKADGSTMDIRLDSSFNVDGHGGSGPGA